MPNKIEELREKIREIEKDIRDEQFDAEPCFSYITQLTTDLSKVRQELNTLLNPQPIVVEVSPTAVPLSVRLTQIEEDIRDEQFGREEPCAAYLAKLRQDKVAVLHALSPSKNPEPEHKELNSSHMFAQVAKTPTKAEKLAVLNSEKINIRGIILFDEPGYIELDQLRSRLALVNAEIAALTNEIDAESKLTLN